MLFTHFSLRAREGTTFYLTFGFFRTKAPLLLCCAERARQDALNNLLLSSSGPEGWRSWSEGKIMLGCESISDRRFNLAWNVTVKDSLERLSSLLSASLCRMHNRAWLTQCSCLPAAPVWVLIVDECIARFAVDTNTSLGSRWHSHSLRERHCTMQLAQ